MKYAWAKEECSENYSGYFDSIGDCISDAILCGEEDYIFVGKQEPIDVYSTIDIDYVIEDIQNNSYCEFDISDEAEKELESRLNKVIADWIEEYELGKNCFRVVDIRKVEI